MATDPTTLAGPSSDGPANDESPPAGRGGSGFGRYVRNRAVGAFVSLLLVLFSSFFLFRILGGDPIDQLASEVPLSPEERAAMRAELGLDQPLSTQFVTYLTDMISGNLGTSYQFRKPIIDVIMERIGPTVLLTGTALVLSVLLGWWIGVKAGWRPGTRFDRTQVGIALTLWSAPTFWIGMIGILIFARQLGIFPVNGMVSPNADPDFLSQATSIAHHLILPAVTLTLLIYANNTLVMRSSILDEVGSDYLTTARAKGLRDDLVRRRHAMPNALLPTVTLVFMQIGGIISGSIITERVFSWPGLGKLFVDAITIRDFPLLQSTFVVFSASVIIANLCAEITYWFLDPRVRRA